MAACPRGFKTRLRAMQASMCSHLAQVEGCRGTEDLQKLLGLEARQGISVDHMKLSLVALGKL